MNDNTKLTNAQLLSTSYNNLQTPKIALMGDRSPVTGLYESEQGGKVLTRKISNGSSVPTQPALVRGDGLSVATADVKNASVSTNVFGFSSVGKGDLNKDLWGRDFLGEPVDNVPAFYWFGYIEDSVDRVEVTPADYQNYNAMATGNTFVRSNESLVKLGTGKKIEIIAGAGGRLTVNISYFGGLTTELFNLEGRTEVWAKAPGIITAHRKVLAINRTSFADGVVDSPDDPRNLEFTFGRGNPGDRSGVGVPNGNFYRLPFDIGTPGIVSPITDLPFYLSFVVVPTSVPVTPDTTTTILNFV
jgi:hypothetical protein